MASGPEQVNRNLQHLNIGEQTVKTHVSHILDKLGVPSRTQAAHMYAVQCQRQPQIDHT
jgi:DNA-binding CsgD family transcriptional regulator